MLPARQRLAAAHGPGAATTSDVDDADENNSEDQEEVEAVTVTAPAHDPDAWKVFGRCVPAIFAKLGQTQRMLVFAETQKQAVCSVSCTQRQPNQK